MLNVTKLLCGVAQPMDALLVMESASGAPRSARERRPVVVWNVSRTCNLHQRVKRASDEMRRGAGE
jgi:hypothetical protein